MSSRGRRNELSQSSTHSNTGPMNATGIQLDGSSYAYSSSFSTSHLPFPSSSGVNDQGAQPWHSRDGSTLDNGDEPDDDKWDHFPDENEINEFLRREDHNDDDDDHNYTDSDDFKGHTAPSSGDSSKDTKSENGNTKNNPDIPLPLPPEYIPSSTHDLPAPLPNMVIREAALNKELQGIYPTRHTTFISSSLTLSLSQNPHCITTQPYNCSQFHIILYASYISRSTPLLSCDSWCRTNSWFLQRLLLYLWAST